MKLSTTFIRQGATFTALALLTLQSASSYAARCEYIIQSDWNNGFVAAVRITNDTSTPINGWSVSWGYSDGTRRTGGWNANVSGGNPYTATGVGWNDRIAPGQSIEFGVQGVKGNANSPAPRPSVTGAVCGGQPPSSVSSSISSSRSSVSSSRVSSSVPSSSVASLGSPSSRSSLSSSSSFSLSLSSSSASSLGPNTAPVANLQTTVTGSTVYVDGRNSTDADGDPLTYSIDFGDGKTINYPHAWHSYLVPGDYTVTLRVSDGRDQASATQVIAAQQAVGNQPPIAMLTAPREYSSIVAHATASFDPEGIPLTYEWDFGDGPYMGIARAGVRDCAPGETISRTRTVTLTVSDGELKDTRQIQAGGTCGYVFDVLPTPKFTYRTEGNQVFVDGRESLGATGLTWNFGDGSPRVSGVLASHTYAVGGTYNIELDVSGPSLFSNRLTQSVTVGFAVSSQSSGSADSSSVQPSSSSRSSTSSLGLPSSSSVRSSSSSPVIPSSSSASSASSNRNHYDARRATSAPVIDGVVDPVWELAAWAPIDVFWLGTQPNPSAQDYSGRYKALWDQDFLYLLFDITDDRLFDGTRNALDRYWEDDTVEIFIDENRSGGQHQYNTSAWAYHVSIYGDVVDYTTSGPKLLNDHINMRLVSVGDKHLWEMRVRIYGEDYSDSRVNTPLTLTAGKLMGFSASYIDNDGSPQRESMMGSVNTQGHKNNQGYIDASVFGSMRLVE